MSKTGQSHLAIVQPDASVDCFEVSQADEGCCNMILSKVEDNCFVDSVFPAKADSSPAATDDECLDPDPDVRLVARGMGLAFLIDKSGALIIQKLDNKGRKVVSAVKCLPHNQLSSGAKCLKPKQDIYSSLGMDPCCTMNDRKSGVLPSICTGSWGAVYHSPNCDTSHSIVPSFYDQIWKPIRKESMSKQKSSSVISEIHVGGLCCASEVPIVDEVVGRRSGVFEVNVNVVLKMAVVNHDPSIISAEKMVEALNDEGLKASILKDGNANSTMANPSPEKTERLTSVLPQWNVTVATILLLVSLLQYLENPSWMKELKYVALGSVALCLPKVLYNSLSRLRVGILDVTTLMSLASIGGIALGEYSEAAAVITIYALSDWLESRASSRIRLEIKGLIDLSPDYAILARNDNLLGPKGTRVPVEQVPIGSALSVPDGGKFPVDGVVISGETYADESAFTGESLPVQKRKGSPVSAGTINVGGNYVEIVSTCLSEDTAVSKMVKLMKETAANTSPTEQFVEKVARVYSLIIFFTSLAMASIPWAFGRETGQRFFMYSLVLLVIGCPCALVISTPIAYVCALAHAAHNGILIKGGRHLETLGALKSIGIDKTGTITDGSFKLQSIEINRESDSNPLSMEQIMHIIYCIENGSSHPIATTLCQAALRYKKHWHRQPSLELVSMETQPGEGVRAIVNASNRSSAENEGLLNRLDVNIYTFKCLGQKTMEKLENVRRTLATTDDVLVVEFFAESASFVVFCEPSVAKESLLEYFDKWGLDVECFMVPIDKVCKDGCCSRSFPQDVAKKALIVSSEEISEEKSEPEECYVQSFLVPELETGEDARVVLKLLKKVKGVKRAKVDMKARDFTVYYTTPINTPELLDAFDTMGFDVSVQEARTVQTGLQAEEDSAEVMKECIVESFLVPELETGEDARTVKKLLLMAKGVEKATVDMKAKRFAVQHQGAVDMDELLDAFDTMGFDVVNEGPKTVSIKMDRDSNSKECGVNAPACKSGCCDKNVQKDANDSKDERTYYVGNKAMALRLGWASNSSGFLSLCDTWEGQGFSYCIFGDESKPIAAFCIGDSVRKESREAVERLHRLGISVTMLTGDNIGAAKHVCQQVGISTLR